MREDMNIVSESQGIAWRGGSMVGSIHSQLHTGWLHKAVGTRQQHRLTGSQQEGPALVLTAQNEEGLAGAGPGQADSWEL